MSFAAIDIGGSGSRVALGDDSGFPLATVNGPSVSIGPGGIDVEKLIATLAHLGETLRIETGLPQPSAVVVGMSGLFELVDRPTRVTDVLARTWPTARAAVASDSVTALVGALGVDGGAVVAVGTGVVGLGSDLRETWNQIDGWGHLLGDTGGGAWVGMCGLQAAVRALDGRSGGSALLLDMVTRDLGPATELPRMLYTRDDRAGVMASFVPAMTEAALAGDPVARGIWERAGRSLAETAHAALVPGVPRRVALVGGLLAAGALLTEPFLQELGTRLPGIDVTIGEGGPLEGAATLARMLAVAPQSVPHHPPFITRVLPEYGGEAVAAGGNQSFSAALG